MKKVLLLLLLSIFSSSLLFAQEQNPDEFEQAVKKAGQQVLDVRTVKEYQHGHLKGALHADWLNKEQFMDRVKFIDKDKPVYVYCAAGPRSTAASKWLRENGYENVYELKGGFTKWKSLGKPFDANSPTEKQMTAIEFENLVKSDKKVLIDFGGEWCPPCVKMEPVLAGIEKDLEGKFKRVKIDPVVHSELASTMKAESFPTLILYKNGKQVWRAHGIVEDKTIREAIQKN